MAVSRTIDPAAELARVGFIETGRALALLSSPPLDSLADCSDVIAAFAAAADPDLALLSLDRVVRADASAGRELVRALMADRVLRARLLLVLGASEALGEHLVRHPDQWHDLAGDNPWGARRPDRDQSIAALRASVAGLDESGGALALRVEYRRHLLSLAARDLGGHATFADVTGELADLADGVLAAALDIARAGSNGEDDGTSLGIVALGKCGGRELNYVSDVDVVFVAPTGRDGQDPDQALARATALAKGVMRVADAVTPEGSIWQVDAALRPEGKSGALVRTLPSYLAYYRRWAQTWEFQALLKARLAAGDSDVGAEYVRATQELVWSAADRPDFVADVQRMRRRVEQQIAPVDAPWQLKLAPGGLRDVEFSVQLLQLVHGRSDPAIRSPNTMAALDALAAWGYVGREDAATLADAYVFLRRLEHRLQLHRLQRTETVPQDRGSLRRLGRAMGMPGDPADELLDAWRQHSLAVRRLHEKLFYRPLLNVVAALRPGEARLSREAAAVRLTALGYEDPQGALRHLAALTSGVSRRAIIQRTLLPVMLGWFADGPDPDAGLLGFRQVSEALGGTPWYLRLLRDESAVAHRLADLLATSRFVSDLLIRAPDFVGSLDDPKALRPRSTSSILREMTAMSTRSSDPLQSISLVRSVRRRELLRIGVAELEHLVGPAETGPGITAITDATIDAALEIANRELRDLRGEGLACRVAVIAVGRLGGFEMGYASDADVMFVFEPVPGAESAEAGEQALSLVNRTIELLQGGGPEPALVVDPSLRPEGKMGPLVRSLPSFEAYYRRWSAPWEAQALLRARWCGGDAALGDRFLAVADGLRYPADGISGDHLREIRRLKARMEAERLPHGTDPALNLKLGRGGLSDVEWVVQLLQLAHASRVPGLRTTKTLDALDAAVNAGLVADADAQTLRTSWLLATRLRNAITLVTGRASDQLSTEPRIVAGVAHVLGCPPGNRGQVVEDYLRASRRARGVMERLFYGWE